MVLPLDDGVDVSSLDPKAKKKAAQAKQNGAKSLPRDNGGIYTTGIAKPHPTAKTEVLYNYNRADAVNTLKVLKALPMPPPEPKVKKGCGQRKNKRDRAGRARHAETCRINQRYPGADVATVRAQVRSGQLT